MTGVYVTRMLREARAESAEAAAREDFLDRLLAALDDDEVRTVLTPAAAQSRPPRGPR